MKTAQGRKAAVAALRKRRAANKDRKPPDNSAAYAGSPMYFPCDACGDLISVPESYITRPRLCAECQAMKELGWLE